MQRGKGLHLGKAGGTAAGLPHGLLPHGLLPHGFPLHRHARPCFPSALPSSSSPSSPSSTTSFLIAAPRGLPSRRGPSSPSPSPSRSFASPTAGGTNAPPPPPSASSSASSAPHPSSSSPSGWRAPLVDAFGRHGPPAGGEEDPTRGARLDLLQSRPADQGAGPHDGLEEAAAGEPIHIRARDAALVGDLYLAHVTPKGRDPLLHNRHLLPRGRMARGVPAAFRWEEHGSGVDLLHAFLEFLTYPSELSHRRTVCPRFYADPAARDGRFRWADEEAFGSPPVTQLLLSREVESPEKWRDNAAVEMLEIHWARALLRHRRIEASEETQTREMHENIWLDPLWLLQLKKRKWPANPPVDQIDPRLILRRVRAPPPSIIPLRKPFAHWQRKQLMRPYVDRADLAVFSDPSLAGQDVGQGLSAYIKTLSDTANQGDSEDGF